MLWWFGRTLDWVAVRQAVGQSNKYLLGLAVLVVCLAYLLRAYRWGALLAPLGPASIKHLFAATTIGFSAVFLIGRTGEVDPAGHACQCETPGYAPVLLSSRSWLSEYMT